MNAQISGVAGRSPARRNRCRLEDFDGFLKLTILAFELFVLPRDIGGHSVTLAGVNLGLVDPAAQRFVGHSQPLGHRGDAGSGLLRPHPLLPDEPDATTALRAGADVVTASGD